MKYPASTYTELVYIAIVHCYNCVTIYPCVYYFMNTGMLKKYNVIYVIIGEQFGI